MFTRLSQYDSHVSIYGLNYSQFNYRVGVAWLAGVNDIYLAKNFKCFLVFSGRQEILRRLGEQQKQPRYDERWNSTD